MVARSLDGLASQRTVIRPVSAAEYRQKKQYFVILVFVVYALNALEWQLI